MLFLNVAFTNVLIFAPKLRKQTKTASHCNGLVTRLWRCVGNVLDVRQCVGNLLDVRQCVGNCVGAVLNFRFLGSNDGSPQQGQH